MVQPTPPTSHKLRRFMMSLKSWSSSSTKHVSRHCFQWEGNPHERTGTVRDSIRDRKTHLTFATLDPPHCVWVGWEPCKVRELYPKPMCSYKCLHSGHIQIRCTKLQVCDKCSSEEHLSDHCDSDYLKCAACSGPHGSYDPSAPYWYMKQNYLNIEPGTTLLIQKLRKNWMLTSHTWILITTKTQVTTLR